MSKADYFPSVTVEANPSPTVVPDEPIGPSMTMHHIDEFLQDT